MSITPVGAAGSTPSHAALAATAKPESAERPGAPDHESDSDNGGRASAAVKAAALAPGTVNLKA
jgi:hypothetical protein